MVTINSPTVSLSLLRGNGDGTFQAPVNVPNTTNLDSPTVVTTDVNNDGMLDVVVGHTISCFTAPCVVGRTISVLLGNGDGTFQPTREVEVGTGISPAREPSTQVAASDALGRATLLETGSTPERTARPGRLIQAS